MRHHLIKGAIYGGIIVFIWGMISWMLIPWHGMTMMKFTNEKEVADIVHANTIEDGIYMLPNMCGAKSSCLGSAQQGAAMTDAKEALKSGPYMFSAISRGGMDPTNVAHYVGGIITQIVAALLIAWLMAHIKGQKYWKKVWFATVAGLFAGIVGYIPSYNWMAFPLSFVGIGILDLLIGWFLAGLAMAKVVK